MRGGRRIAIAISVALALPIENHLLEEGARLISAGSDARVLMWNIAGEPKRTHQ